MSALADRPVRVLVTLGPGHQADEVARRPDNVRVEREIPHSAVLRRAVLMVSHAGHGGVMKALWHGVPMVLVPWGRDQPGVAARAQALGAAEVVPRETAAEELPAAVDRALANEAMRRSAAAHATRLQATDPPVVAAGLLESLL
jgi:UDP:flavonoid glycosyltransferase YjiC (YdhE family)